MSASARVTAFNAWAKHHRWSARCDPDLRLKDEGLKGLLAVWREQARAHPVPRRSQFTARLLKPWLASIALIERVSMVPPGYHLRLVGTRVTLVLGLPNGRILEDVVKPETAERWHAVLDVTLEEQCPLRFVAATAYRGLEHLRAEALHLPLSAEGGPATMVLIGMFFGPAVEAQARALMGTPGAAG
ncbi:MAG: PAS domain-containing protein [Alphaproteobacteria bacterium]|nr:PAS domain-containing protein [Alphaproteobacteria bacterium]